jgi:predicted nucleotidyltransferase component of viral defense system
MCYFLYNLDRFSTDLDFDVLDPAQKETIISETMKIVSSFGELKNETK